MFLIAALAVFTLAADASAQKLAIGERAPELQVSEWLTEKPADGKAQLVDFFHTSSSEAASVLSQMNSFADNYASKLSVVVVAREAASKVRPALMEGSPKYSAAIDDDGKTFAAFGVNVVPFAALTDSRGKVLWFGNPKQLTNEMLDKLLK